MSELDIKNLINTKLMTPQRGITHEYFPRLQAFEFDNGANESAENALLFIGGLTDGLCTVPYLPRLSKSLPEGWTLFQIIFSSSYNGWGTGSLDRDIEEMKHCVRYLKEKLSKKKVVLMGHSTGTQDSIHYSLKDNELIEGIILQAPASDRDAITDLLDPKTLEALNAHARKVYDEQGPDTVLDSRYSSAFLGAPLSAYRWLSLAAKGGDDDYFSEDLPDEQLKATFGKLTRPVLVLYSGNDEFVPKSIDKHALVKRWKGFVDPKIWSQYSAVVEGATHALHEKATPESLNYVMKAVSGFLEELS